MSSSGIKAMNTKQTLSLVEIRNAFDELLSETKTREELSHWASSLMKLQDDDLLVYEPVTDEDRIWNALVYLSGVDLKTDKATYTHAPEDFAAFVKEEL
jgi:hypothetical protein